MPNRKIAPKIHDINKLTLPPVRQVRLDNGIPVYLVEMGSQEVLKLEVVFHAGRPYEHKRLVARATNRLLKEGTSSFSSAQIAEQFDFYGANLSSPINLDTSSLVVYSLTKHLGALLPFLSEMLDSPSFPQEELDTFVDSNIQNLQVELSKNDVVAYRMITEHVFGSDHPYGYNSFPETYRDLQREDLLRHFNALYHSGNCQIILSGAFHADTLPLINRYLGQAIRPGERFIPKIIQEKKTPQVLHIPRPESLQTAIRIGCKLFNKHHPDYQGLYILNTVLGGYFGSRLMTNIREDKGYTYNIFSAIDSFHFDGCFYIGTEVGSEFTKATIGEIYGEMDRLKETLISPEEMQMLRNYLLGSFLSTIDGAFNMASVVKTMVVEDLKTDDFDQLVHLVKTIKPEQLRELAQRYLQRELMWEVVVGGE